MKIAFCAPVDVHSLARYCERDLTGVPPGLGSTATTPLIIELLKRGHEVTVFTLSNELPEECSFDWGALRIFVGKGRTFGSARNLFLPEIKYLRRTIRAEQPAFVHAHWTYEFALGALGTDRPVLVTIHDLPWNVFKYLLDRYRAVRLLMAYAVAMWCRRYTAVSSDAARHFSRYLRPFADVACIPNFVSDGIVALGDQPRAIGHRPFVCAAVLQGWSLRKNAAAALRAFKLVLAVRPDTQLWLIGQDFQVGGPAHLWAQREDLDQGVVFQGLMPYRDLLSLLHRSVDVLVHPSLDEAFSMTIAEGLALGLPVVAGRSTPGVMQALDKGRAGIAVDVRKPEEIAAAILKLSADEGLRHQLGELGRERVKSKYTAKTVVPQYEAMYRDLMAEVITGRKRSKLRDDEDLTPPTPTGEPIRIAVLMTCFNRRDQTLLGLSTLFAQVGIDDASLTVFLVDDASRDGTAEAVARQFPEVRILNGDGSLYWNGGMRKAFTTARSEGFDAYLWFNDDTLLERDALGRLIQAYRAGTQMYGDVIVTGSIANPVSGKRSYGGFVRVAKGFRLDFLPVEPSVSETKVCSTMNGNFTLIPASVVERLGILDAAFHHQLGDVDYGLRATEQGIPVLIAPGFLGGARIIRPPEPGAIHHEPFGNVGGI